MGALDAALGATGALGAAGAFPLVSVGASLMVIEVEGTAEAVFMILSFGVGCWVVCKRVES